MGALIGGVVAVVVGGGLAIATAVGIVNSVQDTPDESAPSSVVDYGVTR